MLVGVGVACGSFESDSPDPAAAEAGADGSTTTDAAVVDAPPGTDGGAGRFCDRVDASQSADGGLFACEDFDGVDSPDADFSPWTPFTQITNGIPTVERVAAFDRTFPSTPPLTLGSKPYGLGVGLVVYEGPVAGTIRRPFPYREGITEVAFDMLVRQADSDGGPSPVVGFLRLFGKDQFVVQCTRHPGNSSLDLLVVDANGSSALDVPVAPTIGVPFRITLAFDLHPSGSNLTATVNETANSFKRTITGFQAPTGITVDLGAVTTEKSTVSVQFDNLTIRR